jgi:hypothetical protein
MQLFLPRPRPRILIEKQNSFGAIHAMLNAQNHPTALRELAQNVKHSPDRLGIEGRGNLVERRDLQLHRKRSSNDDALFCLPDNCPG